MRSRFIFFVSFFLLVLAFFVVLLSLYETKSEIRYNDIKSCNRIMIDEMCIDQICYPVVQQDDNFLDVSREEVFTQFGYVDLNWIMAHRELPAGELISSLSVGDVIRLRSSSEVIFVELKSKQVYSLNASVDNVERNLGSGACFVLQTCEGNDNVVIFSGIRTGGF